MSTNQWKGNEEMNRAELFAKYFNGDFDKCCQIFEDGLILVTACSEGSHEQITQT